MPLPNSPASSPASVPSQHELTQGDLEGAPPTSPWEPRSRTRPASLCPQTRHRKRASRRLHRLSPRKSHYMLTVSLSFTEPCTCHYLQFTVGTLRHGEGNHLFMIPGPGRARAQGWEPRGSCCCSSALCSPDSLGRSSNPSPRPEELSEQDSGGSADSALRWPGDSYS